MLLQEIELTEIKGIGEKRAQAFRRLGVSTLYDLISFYPARYEDRSIFKNASEIADGETVSVEATVADEPRLSRIRKGLDLVKFRAVDDTAFIDITFFNQPYVKNLFRRGETYNFYGKFTVKGNHISISNPSFERSDRHEHSGRIVPVYHLSSGLTQRMISDSVRNCLTQHGNLIKDILPQTLCRKYNLIPEYDAIRNIHFPADYDSLLSARRRLIFEELLIFCCAVARFRSVTVAKSGIIIPSHSDEFINSLPFTPTGAQLRAIKACEKDMSSGRVMSRLVQGDVGSGKTLVAAAVIFNAFRAGYCSAFMVPTEILAQQHYTTLTGMFSSFGMRIEKLTGSVGVKERRRILSLLAAGEVDLIIGTHALFSNDVEYRNLGLVITDEQHRFGVRQRSSLIEKSDAPHVLVMSATPIPRTLALIMYGDLDLSVIDELPPGRQAVDTFVVDSSYRNRLNSFIRKQKADGHQVFIVCPKVEDEEDSDSTNLMSAVDYADNLRSLFPDLIIGCVHGRLPSAEKNEIMSSFAAGETDVLVATTVVEVGVDVPNATLMIIENAERFGLSQLHQLRGRVGRGRNKCWCVLVSDAEGETAKERLKILAGSNDGFKIAEEDLKLRGPGDFFGSKQHGLPEMHIADIASDMELLQNAHDEAEKLLQDDPQLMKEENSSLREATERHFTEAISSFN